MTRIKICGITNMEDALWATKCGADAIGFVFADSPRRITPERAGEVVREIGPFVTTVGVFVDCPVEQAREAMRVSGCTVAQLHGGETEEYIESLGPYAAIKAIRVRDRIDSRVPVGYRKARAILLDTYVDGKAGGTGQRFDVTTAADLVKDGWRVIVAGGLTPGNVGEVVSTVKPYGVDVSSGVESGPGRKDPDKVAQFIEAVRAADAGRS